MELQILLSQACAAPSTCAQTEYLVVMSDRSTQPWTMATQQPDRYRQSRPAQPVGLLPFSQQPLLMARSTSSALPTSNPKAQLQSPLRRALSFTYPFSNLPSATASAPGAPSNTTTSLASKLVFSVGSRLMILRRRIEVTSTPSSSPSTSPSVLPMA